MSEEENSRSGEDVVVNGVAKPQKAAYSTPVLRVYGSVRELTMGSGSVDGDSGPMSMMVGSDRKIKKDIVRIGNHPLGIGLYLFAYEPAYRERFGHGRQFGVMAQEVETVLPQAVSAHPDGYQMVDYEMLGVHRSIQ